MRSGIASLLTDYKKIRSVDNYKNIGTTTEYVKDISSLTDTLCNLNHKLKLHASVWKYQGNESLVLEIRAETRLSNWVQMNYYSMQYTDVSDGKLQILEHNLLDAWMVLNNKEL